ncbi:MAG: hemin uptake protein HemP [Usitatibacteraceae bacterium]
MIKTTPLGLADATLHGDALGQTEGNPPVHSVTSESLLGERGELKIQHSGEQYSLRRTRLGKLILTK